MILHSATPADAMIMAYCARIGFRDTGQDPGFALEDGRKVGRIFRQFDL